MQISLTAFPFLVLRFNATLPQNNALQSRSCLRRYATKYSSNEGINMTKFSKIILGALIVLLTGCGTVNFALKPNTEFNKNSTITIIVNGNDRIGVQGSLEHLFLERGFEVVSEAVARRELKLESESDSTVLAQGGQSKASVISKNTSNQVLSNVKTVKSAYILRTSYNAYYDVFYWAFTSFNATVVDLSSGKVVGSVNFSGDRSVDSVLEDFANKIASAAK